MQRQLLHGGGLEFPERLVSVVGLRPSSPPILLGQPIGKDGVGAPGDGDDFDNLRAKFPGLGEEIERLPIFRPKFIGSVVFEGTHGAIKGCTALQRQQDRFFTGTLFQQDLNCFLAPGESFQVVAHETGEDVLANQCGDGESGVREQRFRRLSRCHARDHNRCK